MSRTSRILIAALKSGSGKTVFTCGLLMALKDRFTRQAAGDLSAASEKQQGLAVTAYKCGPDYIDPMFHKKVLEIDGTNLDPFFSEKTELRDIVAGDQAEISVIEGAMGIYDGITGMGRTGSCYDVAVKTGTPILLVADASGMGATICSVIKGVLLDDTEHKIAGIVFNRMSDACLEMLRPDLESVFAGLGRKVRILGAIPKSRGIGFESRHLGLMMPEEVDDVLKQIRSFADLIEEHIDIEELLAIAGQAEVLEVTEAASAPSGAGALDPLVLGVARDEAFCFYYARNLKAFTDRGVQIREFSPIRDKKLPEDLDGILLGGGYPELHLKELAENASMKDDIRNAIASGMPSLAECGGFMYLGKYIEENGIRYPMAGVLEAGFENKGKLTRFGYVTVSPEQKGLLKDPIKAHEFHYYDSGNNGADCVAQKPGSGRSWPCVHMGDTYLWGYPHLYYPSNPKLVDDFIERMWKYSALKK